MREILFRGKRNDDSGAWHYGGYVCDDSIDPNLHSIMEHRGTVFVKCPVNPSTVGQFTGLTDKNGKKIFEGDIIKLGGNDLPHWLKEGEIKVVEYNDGCFYPFNEYDSDCGTLVEASYCEIIGNIYDNPELLEVSGDA